MDIQNVVIHVRLNPMTVDRANKTTSGSKLKTILNQMQFYLPES